VADIEAAVNAAFAKNGGQTPSDHGQFSKERYSFLFKPGRYNVEVPVGYYTHVAGLGDHPSDVVFTSAKGVYCDESSASISPGSLDTFWRTVENFQTDANYSWNGDGRSGMVWASSQGTSLRRLIVTNDLSLSRYRKGNLLADYASGGYMSNTVVKGVADSGSQQQFLSRNSEVRSWSSGVWNMVFVGVKGAPASHCGLNTTMCTKPYTTVDSTPVIAEKPYITISEEGKYTLNVPMARKASKGVDMSTVTKVDFEKVYVASAEKDTAETINAQLKQGLHVVLAPGIYNLDAALELTFENQVLLGQGMATLVATNGNAVVKVGNVDGVRVAGMLLQAGSKLSDALLEWGDAQKYPGSATNPGVMTDVDARVGGPSNPAGAQAKVMVIVNSGHVVIDNAWLWRADHVEGGGLTMNGSTPCSVGAIINGNDVTAYGLKIEHCLTDLLQWNGDRGATYFFQSEMAYDVTQENFGDKGYVAYRVAENVTEHRAFGTGVYHNFRDHAVTVRTAISAPKHLENAFVSPLAVFLNGKGVMQHILNDLGSETSQSAQSPTAAIAEWLCHADVPPSAPLQLVLSSNVTCKVGDSVTCPGSTAGCAGNSCCADGSTCPSADEEFSCCPAPKKLDCVKPASAGHLHMRSMASLAQVMV
jgi:hypothetical protein